MKNISINTQVDPDRTFPTLAVDTHGEMYLVHRVHQNKDAVLWALSLSIDGERRRFEDMQLELLPIGASVTMTV